MKGTFSVKDGPKSPDQCCPALSHSLCISGGDLWQGPTVSQANELSKTHPHASPPRQVIIMRAVSGGWGWCKQSISAASRELWICSQGISGVLWEQACPASVHQGLPFRRALWVHGERSEFASNVCPNESAEGVLPAWMSLVWQKQSGHSHTIVGLNSASHRCLIHGRNGFCNTYRREVQ